MAIDNTYTAIATNTLGSAAASVTFSSISGSYTDLVFAIAPLGAGEELVAQFNGDTGTNYSRTTLWGNGTTAGSVQNSAQTYAILNYYAAVGSTQATQIWNVMNYANTTTYKTILGRASKADGGVDATVALWRSTAAITSVVFKQKNGGNFSIGSTFSLYGIKAA